MGKKPTKKRKDPAAVALGKKRWRSVPSEERSRIMRETVLKRWKKKS